MYRDSTSGWKGTAGDTANKGVVEGHDRLAERQSAELDDVLCTIQLVAGDPGLQARLFEQLVDLLVEGMFLDLRRAHLAGELGRDRYVDELALLAERCRAVGLLPLPSRHV